MVTVGRIVEGTDSRFETWLIGVWLSWEGWTAATGRTAEVRRRVPGEGCIRGKDGGGRLCWLIKYCEKWRTSFAFSHP